MALGEDRRKVDLPFTDMFVVLDRDAYDVEDADEDAFARALEQAKVLVDGRFLTDAAAYEGTGSAAYGRLAARINPVLLSPLLMNHQRDVFQAKIRAFKRSSKALGIDSGFVDELKGVGAPADLARRQRSGALVQRYSSEAGAQGQYGVPTFSGGDPPSEEQRTARRSTPTGRSTSASRRWRRAPRSTRPSSATGATATCRTTCTAPGGRTRRGGGGPDLADAHREPVRLLRPPEAELHNNVETAWDKLGELRKKLLQRRATPEEYDEAYQIAMMFAARRLAFTSAPPR